MRNILSAINKTLITLLSFNIVSTDCGAKTLSVIIVKNPAERNERGGNQGSGYGRRGVI
jgi:hypothetical protein